jgi:Leucine-rich repeat (LRR) protein
MNGYMNINDTARKWAPFSDCKMRRLCALLDSNKKFKKLNLSRCGIKNNMIKELCKNRTLTHLDLGYNLLTVGVAKNLLSMTELQYLSLVGNRLSEKGINLLREKAHFKVFITMEDIKKELGK